MTPSRYRLSRRPLRPEWTTWSTTTNGFAYRLVGAHETYNDRKYTACAPTTIIGTGTGHGRGGRQGTKSSRSVNVSDNIGVLWQLSNNQKFSEHRLVPLWAFTQLDWSWLGRNRAVFCKHAIRPCLTSLHPYESTVSTLSFRI